jgi:hypothetical protein
VEVRSSRMDNLPESYWETMRLIAVSLIIFNLTVD